MAYVRNQSFDFYINAYRNNPYVYSFVVNPIVRRAIAQDTIMRAFVALRGVNLSALMLTAIGLRLQSACQFGNRVSFRNMWQLAKLVKHWT